MVFGTAGDDILYIYDGNSTSAPLITSVSANVSPDPVISTGRHVLITFKTNAVSSDIGFFLMALETEDGKYHIFFLSLVLQIYLPIQLHQLVLLYVFVQKYLILHQS